MRTLKLFSFCFIISNSVISLSFATEIGKENIRNVKENETKLSGENIQEFNSKEIKNIPENTHIFQESEIQQKNQNLKVVQKSDGIKEENGTKDLFINKIKINAFNITNEESDSESKMSNRNEAVVLTEQEFLNCVSYFNYVKLNDMYIAPDIPNIKIQDTSIKQNASELHSTIEIKTGAAVQYIDVTGVENPQENLEALLQTNMTGVERGSVVQYFNLTDEEMERLEHESYGELPNNWTSYEEDTTRLVGSTEVTDISLYPYVVYISTDKKDCTGVILSVNFVLTAASCVYDAGTIDVFSGSLTGTGTAVSGAAIIHPKFYSNTLHHDIALVRLTTPIAISGTVNFINLARKYNVDESKDVVGKTMRIFGFGSDPTSTTTPPALRVTKMTVMSSYQCLKALKANQVLPATTQNCLDTENGVLGMCSQADVGGPVTYKFKDDSQYTLVGILSYYQVCGSSVPNLFTRIGPYLDLIHKYIPSFINQG